MMSDEQADEMKKAYHQNLIPEDFYRSALIRDELEMFLSINLLNAKMDADLNPHLTIEAVCRDVSEQVRTKGSLSCSKEDVMLFWLTTIIYSDNKEKWL